MNLDALYSNINSEEIDTIDLLPRAAKMEHLALLMNLPTAEALKEIVDATDLPLLNSFDLIEDPSQHLPVKLIHEYHCVPIEEKTSVDTDSDSIALVTLWPPDAQMDRWIFASCGKKPKWYLSDPEKIQDTITEHFGVGADSLDESSLIEDVKEDDIVEDEDAAIIRFVNEVIFKAVSDRATDIHFEPLRDSLQIRYRIDGELISIRVPDNLIRFQDAIISRLKIMAKLNISEKRRPQDGRISFASGDSELDIRISTIPTMYGESISLRLLNQKSKPLTMKELGLSSHEERILEKVLSAPHGIILVTGPTGSGKSTSLTAFIRLINRPERRIITVEDPVEYEVPGINQTQVHPEIGLTFAQSLRSVLRQDPDVIMVGEIRDRETADIGIRASLTGHLVLSTLHTNDAPGALTRLIDMDIEPFLIASSVELIVAQRLVRKLCPHCAQPANYEADYLENCLKLMNIPVTEENLNHPIYKAGGCDKCRNIGFKGRIGIFECLSVSEEIHEQIVQKASARAIRQTAVEQGMRSLTQSGWNHVKQGLTSLEEVMRYAEIDSEEEN